MGSQSREDIAQRIAQGPMSRQQVLAVIVCILINAIDGFDVQATAFTAPAIARDWAVGPANLGILFSAGLAGMALGALFLSPLADRFGRRSTILACLPVIAAGMAISAFCETLTELAMIRGLTGIGIGTLISSISALVSEYSSDRRRGLAMGFMAVSFPAGAMLGGTLAILLIDRFGWQAVYMAGAVLTIAVIPLTIWMLPESLSFLMKERGADARDRLNKQLGRLGYREVGSLNHAAEKGTPTSAMPVRLIFSPALRVHSVRLCLLFLLVMLSFYFILSWAPRLTVQAGAPATMGLTIGLLINLGGVAGGLTVGLIMPRYGLQATGRFILVAMGALIATFGAVIADLGPLKVIAVLLGFSMWGVQACIYTAMTTAFPVAARATGIGLVSTTGRIGSVLGPLIGGWCIASGASITVTCLLFAVPAIVGGIIFAPRQVV